MNENEELHNSSQNRFQVLQILPEHSPGETSVYHAYRYLDVEANFVEGIALQDALIASVKWYETQPSFSEADVQAAMAKSTTSRVYSTHFEK